MSVIGVIRKFRHALIEEVKNLWRRDFFLIYKNMKNGKNDPL
jgi:hypothetical protein